MDTDRILGMLAICSLLLAVIFVIIKIAVSWVIGVFHVEMEE